MAQDLRFRMVAKAGWQATAARVWLRKAAQSNMGVAYYTYIYIYTCIYIIYTNKIVYIYIETFFGRDATFQCLDQLCSGVGLNVCADHGCLILMPCST